MMRLRHELIIARKYVRPEMVKGIWVAPAWRTDNSRSLWEVVQSSEEADEKLKVKLLPGWILVTPPRSGVFLRHVVDEREDGRPEVVEEYLLHSDLVARIVPWTSKGEEMKTLGNRILVRPDEVKEKTDSGLVLPDASKTRPVTGVVVDVGPEVKDEMLTAGTRILYSQFAGTDVEIDGKRFVLLTEEQPMMTLDEEEVGVA